MYSIHIDAYLYMCVCVCMKERCTCVHKYIYMVQHTYKHICACVRTYGHTPTHARMYTHTNTHTHMCLHTCIHIYIHTHTYMHIDIYIRCKFIYDWKGTINIKGKSMHSRCNPTLFLFITHNKIYKYIKPKVPLATCCN